MLNRLAVILLWEQTIRDNRLKYKKEMYEEETQCLSWFFLESSSDDEDEDVRESSSEEFTDSIEDDEIKLTAQSLTSAQVREQLLKNRYCYSECFLSASPDKFRPFHYWTIIGVIYHYIPLLELL